MGNIKFWREEIIKISKKNQKETAANIPWTSNW